MERLSQQPAEAKAIYAAIAMTAPTAQAVKKELRARVRQRIKVRRVAPLMRKRRLARSGAA